MRAQWASLSLMALRLAILLFSRSFVAIKSLSLASSMRLKCDGSSKEPFMRTLKYFSEMFTSEIISLSFSLSFC